MFLAQQLKIFSGGSLSANRYGMDTIMQEKNSETLAENPKIYYTSTGFGVRNISIKAIKKNWAKICYIMNQARLKGKQKFLREKNPN